MQYIVAYDFGTTGVKTCLFSIDGGIRMEASAYAPTASTSCRTAARSRMRANGGPPCAAPRAPHSKKPASGPSR